MSGVVAPAIATAEVRKTTTAVSLRKRPGEKAAVVAKLPANTEVQIVRVEGRWLFVRVNRAEGYLPRTTVSLPESQPAGDASGWSAARGSGTQTTAALYVEVTAPSAILHAAPEATSATLATLAKGVKLAVVDAATHPSWVRGHDDAGHEGWIARAEVTDGATTVAIGTEVREATPGGGFHRGPVRRLAIRTDVGLGMRTLGMDLTSNTEGGLTNYIVDAQAIAATLAVDAVQAVARPVGSSGSTAHCRRATRRLASTIQARRRRQERSRSARSRPTSASAVACARGPTIDVSLRARRPLRRLPDEERRQRRHAPARTPARG